MPSIATGACSGGTSRKGVFKLTRDEAEKLVGKTVHCWSALNGCYVGELLEVVPSRPWRGRVKILAVTEYPVQGLSDFRSGFRARKPAGYGGNPGIWLHQHKGAPRRSAGLQNVSRSGAEKNIQKLEGAISGLARMGRCNPLLKKWLAVLRERLKEAKNIKQFNRKGAGRRKSRPLIKRWGCVDEKVCYLWVVA